MKLDDKEVKLKIGDIMIFRRDDGVVQFMRGSQRLLDQRDDDKSIVDNDPPLNQDLCSNIANIIAITHGFGVIPLDALYLHSGLFYYKFTKLKQAK